ncbi:MAG: hypothetical protein ACOC6G_01015 [Thermoproteota archaeon]
MSYSRRRDSTVTHEECIHFKDGFCMLNGIPVNPHQPACPHFTPSDKRGTPQSIKAQPSQKHIAPYVHPAYPLPYKQSVNPHSRYAQNNPYPPSPQDIHSYHRIQPRDIRPKQGTTPTYSLSSGRRGGGNNVTGRRGGGRKGNRGRGRRQGRGFAGPGGSCVCPNCDYMVPHRPGTPCLQQKCPKCGTSMVRKN